MTPALPKRFARRRSRAARRVPWLTLALAALLTAATPEVLRLSYDPAALLDGSCLAPEYAGPDCEHLRSLKIADRRAISASGALSGSDDVPVLMLDVRGLLEQADEVTYGTVRPPSPPDLRGRRRP